MRYIFRTTPYATIIAATLLATACSGPTSSTSVTETSEGQVSAAVPGKDAALNNSALIRFFNADTQRKTLSIFAQKKPVFSDIAYKSITPYMEAERGVSQFVLRAPNKSNDLAATRRELFPGRHYTLIALPNHKGDARLESFSDNLAKIDPGEARVRLINATASIKDLDLYAQGTDNRILRASGSGDVVSFAEMYAGNVEIRADKKTMPKALTNLIVEPGKLYTFIAVDDGGMLDVVQIVDQLEGDGPANTRDRSKP